MNELSTYISLIKRILDADYGKERVFYDDGDWYDRHRSRNMTLEELEQDVLSLFADLQEEDEKEKEYQEFLEGKLVELMGEKEADAFIDSFFQKKDSKIDWSEFFQKFEEEREKNLSLNRFKCWDCEEEIYEVQIDEETKGKCITDHRGFRYLICKECQKKSE